MVLGNPNYDIVKLYYNICNIIYNLYNIKSFQDFSEFKMCVTWQKAYINIYKDGGCIYVRRENELISGFMYKSGMNVNLALTITFT